jgi:DNA-directed RNA polymerase subunit N (RpoN/RPB10)
VLHLPTLERVPVKCGLCGQPVRDEATPYLAKRHPLQPWQRVDADTGLRHYCPLELPVCNESWWRGQKGITGVPSKTTAPAASNMGLAAPPVKPSRSPPKGERARYKADNEV